MFEVNRTSACLASRYELDKVSTSNWNFPLTNLGPQIKILIVGESKIVFRGNQYVMYYIIC